MARLRAALRVRTLHATVLRRLRRPQRRSALSRDRSGARCDRAADRPRRRLSRAVGRARRAHGRGRRASASRPRPSISTPATSTASCSAKALAARVVDAFLTVLSEDARFRNLPVVLTLGRAGADLRSAQSRNHLRRARACRRQRAAADPPACLRGASEPHAARDRRRAACSIRRTGLLTPAAFERDFASAVDQTLPRGGGLSVARFAFDPDHPRAQFDGARIISRLMRQDGFRRRCRTDGRSIVVFAETDLRNAHAIARRLSSVMRHTTPRQARRAHRAGRDGRDAACRTDSAKSLLARLYDEAPRAAS